MKNKLKKLSILLLSLTFFNAQAEISSDLEPDYAEAVLAYNAQNFDRAMMILEVLKKKSPNTTEFLELNAIILKSQRKDSEASQVYRQLIQLKTKEGKDRKEIAPYAFELGMYRFNEKKLDQAEQYLNFALRNQFNKEMCQFYLGMIATHKMDWDKAEKAFKSVIASEIEEIKPAAHFYLAQSYFKSGSTSSGFGQLRLAKSKAEKVIAQENASNEIKQMSEQIKTAADAALKPFDKTQKFGNFNLLTGYDTNVLLVPSNIPGNANVSGKETLKTLLSLGYGIATSPVKEFQFVPSVKFNLNKNWNRESATGEFSDVTASLYVSRYALSSLVFGLKTENIAIFQNDYNSTTGKSKYRLYNTSLGIGPYTRWEVSRKWTINADFLFRKLDFNNEADLQQTLRRTGTAYGFKVSGMQKTNKKYFNPVYTVRAEFGKTEGTEFDSNAFGFGISNIMKLSKIDLVQNIDFTKTKFPNSTADRSDNLIVLGLVATKKIGPRWSVMATADYTKNTSTDEQSYTYDRMTTNAGVSYVF